MRSLVELAKKHDLWLISDEIYEDLIFAGEHVPAARFDAERVITVSGVSKSYAMTGWRIGWAITNPELVALCGKIQEALVSCPPAISQAAAEAAVRGPQDAVEEMRAAYQRRRDLVREILEPVGLLPTIPEGAFYAMVDLRGAGIPSRDLSRMLLEEERVAAAPGSTFGDVAEGMVRISLATADDDLAEGCRRIVRFAERHGALPLAGTVAQRGAEHLSHRRGARRARGKGRGRRMILLTIRDGDNLRLGVKTARGVIDVAAAQAALGQGQGDGRLPQTVEAAIAGGEAARSALADLVARAEAADATGSPWLMDEESLTLGPAVPNPGKIVCVGLNYRKHAEETGAAIPTSPVLFSKFSNTVAGPDEDVPLTDAATQYDYEVELAVVMGETTKNVSAADALNTVFGYATANDLSARDLQNRTSQWMLGKTMDKFMPIGPYLVTADQVGGSPKTRHPHLAERRVAAELEHRRHDLPGGGAHRLHQPPFHARAR